MESGKYWRWSDGEQMRQTLLKLLLGAGFTVVLLFFLVDQASAARGWVGSDATSWSGVERKILMGAARRAHLSCDGQRRWPWHR